MGKKALYSEEKALKKAEELGKKADCRDVAKIEKKLPFMQRGPVKKIWDKVLFLWEAYKKAEIPPRLQLTVIGALLYLILPADLLPDAIPGLGLLDDATVIALVFTEVSKFVVPKVVEKTKEKLQESYYTKIDFKLKEAFFQMLLNSAISFVINMAGIAILVVKPLGENSLYFALGIFSLTTGFLIFRMIRYFVRYGKVTFEIAKLVLKEKSLSRGVSRFVQEKYPVITKIYAGINLAQNFVPGLDSIPDFDMIVKDLIKHFRKKVLLVWSLFLLYSAVIAVVKFVLYK